MREGWEYKRLGELCDIVMGQSPMGNSINENNGIEFHQGKTNFGDKFLMESGIYTTSPIRIAEKKTILLCVRAPVGIINITERQVCIGRGLSSLKPRLGLELLYLYYCLLSKQNYFESNSTGSTFKAISSKVINNTIIQFPPKPTQLSIVSELDKLNELIQIKKEQLKDYDTLAQSIFYEMFGDPVENEKGWEVKELIETVIPECKISYGIVQPGEHVEDGVPIVRPVDMLQTFISKDGLKKTTKEISNSYNRTILTGKELLICVRGTTGVVSLVDESLKGANVTRGIAPLLFSMDVERWFMYYQIKTPSVRGVISSLTRGIALKQINMSDLRKIQVILPPLPLQHSFAQKIEQIEQQKAAIQKTITDLETLLAARMQYWFD